jgi:hypothetical protein
VAPDLWVSALRQTPYRPIKIGINIVYPKGRLIAGGFRVFDVRGSLVYRSGRTAASGHIFARQPYAASVYTVPWSKRGLDGLPVRTGVRYTIVPWATTYREDANGFFPNDHEYSGSRYTFTLR